MAPRMRAQPQLHTAMNGCRGRDALVEGAAAAHADAERGRTDAEVARRYTGAGRKTSRRAASEWKRTAPPESREFHAYLLVVADPYRIEASVRATVKRRALAKLSNAELIERYRDLLRHEPQVEAQDRILDVTRGVSWAERAAASERDSAIEAEKAACAREFAARGISEQQVFDGRPH